MRTGGSISGAIIVIWLLIGVLAAAQRGYFSDAADNCAEGGTIVVTVLAGPLNYIGVNPKIDCGDLPEPSQ